MKDVKEIREFIEQRKASVYYQLQEDIERKHDPINGQHMRGRAAVEEHYVEDLEKLLNMLAD